jgi:hypothetical protein
MSLSQSSDVETFISDLRVVERVLESLVESPSTVDQRDVIHATFFLGAAFEQDKDRFGDFMRVKGDMAKGDYKIALSIVQHRINCAVRLLDALHAAEAERQEQMGEAA